MSDYIENLIGKVLSVRVFLPELTLRDFRGVGGSPGTLTFSEKFYLPELTLRTFRGGGSPDTLTYQLTLRNFRGGAVGIL